MAGLFARPLGLIQKDFKHMKNNKSDSDMSESAHEKCKRYLDNEYDALSSTELSASLPNLCCSQNTPRVVMDKCEVGALNDDCSDDARTEDESVNVEPIDANLETPKIEPQWSECKTQLSNNSSLSMHEPADTVSADQVSVTGSETLLLSALKNAQLDTTSEDIDLEKSDELTLIKESPRSSPGNTLDSGVCSLGRADSFGKTDASSFSSVSSISVECSATVDDGIAEEYTDETIMQEYSIAEEPSNGENSIKLESAETPVSETNRTVKPKQRTLTFGSFLARFVETFGSSTVDVLTNVHRVMYIY